jgi:ribosomal protein S18 acetylase RimI-like enzyme
MIFIETPNKQDLPLICQLDNAIFPSDGYGRTSLRQFFDLSPDLLFVAKSRDLIVGYCMGGRGAGNQGWLLSLAVEPSFRSLGIGRQLTEEFCRTAFKLGYSSLRLTVAESNLKAIRMYERIGFTKDAFEADYFLDGSGRIVMAMSA